MRARDGITPQLGHGQEPTVPSYHSDAQVGQEDKETTRWNKPFVLLVRPKQRSHLPRAKKYTYKPLPTLWTTHCVFLNIFLPPGCVDSRANTPPQCQSSVYIRFP